MNDLGEFKKKVDVLEKNAELNNQLEVNMVKLIDKISQIRKWMEFFSKNVTEKGWQVVNDLRAQNEGNCNWKKLKRVRVISEYS